MTLDGRCRAYSDYIFD